MIARSVAAAVVAGRVTTRSPTNPKEQEMGHDAVREVLALNAAQLEGEVSALREAYSKLIQECEALDAERRAWAEVARKGVRLVEHITVTQSTDGQWKQIADLYESFDTLVDAARIDDASTLDPEAFSIASDARRKATR